MKELPKILIVQMPNWNYLHVFFFPYHIKQLSQVKTESKYIYKKTFQPKGKRSFAVYIKKENQGRSKLHNKFKLSPVSNQNNKKKKDETNGTGTQCV